MTAKPGHFYVWQQDWRRWHITPYTERERLYYGKNQPPQAREEYTSREAAEAARATIGTEA